MAKLHGKTDSSPMVIFFVSPLVFPRRSQHAVTPMCTSYRPYANLPRRYRCFSMSASNGNSGTNSSPSQNNGEGQSENNDDTREDLVAMGRFKEFIIPSEGDERTRDDIARLVLRQAMHLSASENIDSTIQANLNLLADFLSQLYARSEREILERNEKMTIRSSLPIMAKVNQKVIAGQKSVEIQKQAISKELQLVEALLRQTSRKNKSSHRNSRRRRTRSTHSQPLASEPTSYQNALSILARLKTPAGCFFTLVVCAVFLETFDTIVAGDGGSEKLTTFSAWSTLFLLAFAYMDALRLAARKAKRSLERGTALYRRESDN